MLSRKGCVVWGVVSGLCGIEVFSRRDKMNKEKKKNVADKWNTKCLRQIEEEKKKNAVFVCRCIVLSYTANKR